MSTSPAPTPAPARERLCDAVHDRDVLARVLGVDVRNTILDPRSIRVDAPAAQTFAPIAAIGGERGWYALDWLWNLRGGADRLLGGPGMRGRARVGLPAPGDVIDVWKVEVCEPDALLRLRCEMRMPGRSWLEFAVEPLQDDESLLRMTTVFERSPVAGRLYWWGLFPAHEFAFTGMISGLARRAEAPWDSDAVAR